MVYKSSIQEGKCESAVNGRPIISAINQPLVFLRSDFSSCFSVYRCSLVLSSPLKAIVLVQYLPRWSDGLLLRNGLPKDPAARVVGRPANNIQIAKKPSCWAGRGKNLGTRYSVSKFYPAFPAVRVGRTANNIQIAKKLTCSAGKGKSLGTKLKVLPSNPRCAWTSPRSGDVILFRGFSQQTPLRGEVAPWTTFKNDMCSD